MKETLRIIPSELAGEEGFEPSLPDGFQRLLNKTFSLVEFAHASLIIYHKDQPSQAGSADHLLTTLTLRQVYHILTDNANETLTLATSVIGPLTLPEFVAEVSL